MKDRMLPFALGLWVPSMLEEGVRVCDAVGFGNGADLD